MYIVKRKDTDEVVAMCSRREDAEAFVRTTLDEVEYIIVTK